MNNINRLKKLLLLMEKQNNYFYIHGGDILISFFTLLIVWGIFTYLSFKKKKKYYQKNWPEHRCDPAITPFAGFLNPPPGSNFKEKMEYTVKNYAICNMNILQSNVGLFTKPMKGTQNMIAFLLVIALSSLDFLRNIYNIIRNVFMDIIGKLFGKFANVMIQVQLWLANLKDTFWKIGGTLINFFFFTLASFYTSLSVLNNLVAVVLIILAIITIVSLFFLALIWVAPWLGVPSYIAWSLAYLGLSVPLLIVAIFAAIVNESSKQQQCDSDPNCCFHGETLVNTENGEKKMSNIVIGEKLKNDNIVHSIIKIKANEPLYNLNDVLVSGNHYFYCKQNGYIKVKDSKNSKITDIKTNYYYCLITSKKEIIINDTRFCDWDDLDITDMMKLKNMFNIKNVEELNEKFNSCFNPNTIIYLKNQKKKIKNIKIGDELIDGSQVEAIIKTNEPTKIIEYSINNKKIIGKNIYFSNLGDFNKIKEKEIKTKGKVTYYSIITNTGTLNLENIEIKDHNYVFDTLVDKYNRIFI